MIYQDLLYAHQFQVDYLQRAIYCKRIST